LSRPAGRYDFFADDGCAAGDAAVRPSGPSPTAPGRRDDPRPGADGPAGL
jgi:hypothetical protein